MSYYIINDPLKITNDLNITGAATILNNLSITGTINKNGTTILTSDGKFTEYALSDISIGVTSYEDISVTGIATIENLSISDTLSIGPNVTDSFTLSNQNSSFNISGDLEVLNLYGKNSIIKRYRTTTQSISSNSNTDLNFNSGTEINYGSDITINNDGSFTINTDGLYHVDYYCRWATGTNSTGIRLNYITKNNDRYGQQTCAGNIGDEVNSGSALLKCVQNDTIKIIGYQSSGSTLNIFSSGFRTGRVTIYRVS